MPTNDNNFSINYLSPSCNIFIGTNASLTIVGPSNFLGFDIPEGNNITILNNCDHEHNIIPQYVSYALGDSEGICVINHHQAVAFDSDIQG